MTYSEKLKDPRWQETRLRVFDRDGFLCRDCAQKTNTLHVHHTFYAKGNPWDTPMEFMLTLCAPCHSRREELEGKCRMKLARVFSGITISDLVSFSDDFLAEKEYTKNSAESELHSIVRYERPLLSGWIESGYLDLDAASKSACLTFPADASIAADSLRRQNNHAYLTEILERVLGEPFSLHIAVLEP